MNDNKIITAVEKGIKNITNGELINGYLYITGKPLTGNCSGCVRRKAWNTLHRYYLELKSKEKEKEDEPKTD